jgi:O-antigen ligase
VITKKNPWWIWVGILYSFKFFLYSTFPYGIKYAFLEASDSLFLPVVIAYVFYKYRDKINFDYELIRIALIISIFLIFSAVPFLVGLKTLNPETSLEKYGLNLNAIKGLFYHIAVSSKLFVISTLFVIANYKKFNNKLSNKILFAITIALGIFEVYLSFTRTGWFAFILGLFFWVFYNKKFSQKLLGVFYAVIILYLSTLLYNSNEAFRLRLEGGATYRKNVELSFDRLASSRVPFIFVAIDNIDKSDFLSKLIGYGTLRGIDLFEMKTGMAIVSHNRTFEILEASGIIGLVFFIIFLYGLIKTLFKFKLQNKLKLMVKLSLLLYFFFFFTSHGTPIYGELIFALVFNLVLIRNYQFNIIKYAGSRENK